MFFKQLILLLWKNTILRKRHWIRTLVEIIWPLFLFSILVAIRKSQEVETQVECHYAARAMPSAGIYPWMKSLLCELQNPCYTSELPSEVPGQINDLSSENNNLDEFGNILELLGSFSNFEAFNNIVEEIADSTNLTTTEIFAAFLSNNSLINPALLFQAGADLLNLFPNPPASSPLQQLLPLLETINSSFFDNSADFNLSSLTSICGYPNVTTSNPSVSSISQLVGLGMSDVFQNFNSSDSNFCTDLINMFENNDEYSFFWDTAKPLLLGTIPYSPDTDLVQSIIRRANSTFETLGFVQMFGQEWESTIGPNLYQFLENGTLLQAIRNILSSDDTLEILAAQLNVTTDILVQLRTFLSNDDDPNDSVTTWKDIYRPIDNLIVLITKLLQCFELNKFKGFPSEDQLVDFSLQLVQNRTLWGGVVFLSPSALDTDLPEIVKYKIRQDAGYATRTTSIQRFFWRPGAEAGISQVKYYVNGFVHIQDMIERAIVETSLLNNTEPDSDISSKLFGNYLVEMPYPCYTRDSYWQPTANADYSANAMAYYFAGFLFLQDMIDRALISWTRSNSTDNNIVTDPQNFFGVYLQEFPYPCYSLDEFLEYLAVLLSLLLTLAWIYSVCIIIKNIVYEKEQRLKEVMKMMGLSNGVHWVAWFIDSFMIMFISILLLMIVLWAGAITPFSNMFIVGLWLVCFAIATITLCFFISVFFSRANLAAACGGIIFFLLYIPYNMVITFDDQMTLTTKIIACLLSNVAFGYGAAYISQYEMSGNGIQFDNWSSSPDPRDELTFTITLIMLLVDACIYMTLAWYIENVFPGKYGVPKPFYFFLTRSYWCGTSTSSKASHSEFSNGSHNSDVKLESEPNHLTLGVSIRNLRKVYKNGKVAVDDLSLNFYEGQITSFLGHNGAGKTTTMSMLTGLFTPTSGSASIYGKDIGTQMDSIRHQLGFCPQHNVLFGDLTVYEHLRFYSALKQAAGSSGEKNNEIESMLSDVGLPHKRDEISRHLSGGMKRKLSVAVAFVGGSKCVILDEPTAGVDPYARRGIWDLLLRYRSNRTIILSTHHMDEADLLGDRIAIISHGKLKCCGSSLFLKSSFGVGYYLTVVKKSTDELAEIEKTEIDDASIKASDEGFESSNQSLSIKGDEQNYANDAAISSYITNIVLRTVDDSKVHEENPRELTFILPYGAQASGKFSEIFDKLNSLNVNYGITDTSLEEIFLNVAESSKDEAKEENSKCCFCIPRRRNRTSVASFAEDTEDQARIGLRSRASVRQNSISTVSVDAIDGRNESSSGFTDGSLGKGSYQVTGKKLVWQQFKALLVKRFHHSKRNYKGVIAQVIVPAGFIGLALVFSLIVPQEQSLPPLELQPWMYGDTNTFVSNDMPDSNLSSGVTASLLESPTIGMRCVNSYSVENFDGGNVTCQRNKTGNWESIASVESLSQETYSNSTIACQCTDKDTRVLLAECPIGTNGSATPRVTLRSSDLMYNMSGRNVSDWLVKTVDQFIQKRYGGLSLGQKFNRQIIPEQVSTLLEFLQSNSNSTANPSQFNVSATSLLEGFARSENAKVWFDNNGYHSMPTWLNILNNAALRSTITPDKNPDNYGIAVVNHPLNYTSATIDLAALSQSITDTLISISVIFALSFVPASFVLFLIDERTSKAKHLQFVSGVNQAIYWIASFLWDMINYMIPTIIVLIIFLCFQTKAYVSADNLPCLFLLLFLYGFAITPMMYPASFYFEVPSTAYVVLTCVNIFIGINTSIATFILELLDDPDLNEVNSYLVQVFLIFPQYCLGRGLIDMALNQAYADAYASVGINGRFVDPFTFDLVGRNLLAMAVEGFGFFIITLLIQYRFFIKPRILVEKDFKGTYDDADCDGDVLAEKKRLLSGQSTDIIQVKNLTKIFKKTGTNKNLIAVDRLSFGVPEGECFGLLGVNGAGKTTTFKMLTGDITPTAGDALVCHLSVLDELREVQQNTGYCPQFEALNPLLTGREHLIFYSKLRGVPPEDMDKVADWGIENFGLKIYANKPAGTYSGGNKRKLSAAIAFIGCPPVVFLDEPTAGMDPMSRRFLWGRISEAVRGGRCIILTSHSMEECEALCSRLAIMVNGRLKCIGSPQHLKIKYGEGYSLTIKVDGNLSNFDHVMSFIATSFPTAMLKENHCNMLIYQLPLKEVKLKYLFEVMEENKEKFNIEDYSINQTTLDEVFVNFAKNQTDGVVLEDSSVMNGFAKNGVLPVSDANGVTLQNIRIPYSPPEFESLGPSTSANILDNNYPPQDSQANHIPLQNINLAFQPSDDVISTPLIFTGTAESGEVTNQQPQVDDSTTAGV